MKLRQLIGVERVKDPLPDPPEPARPPRVHPETLRQLMDIDFTGDTKTACNAELLRHVATAIEQECAVRHTRPQISP